MSKNKEIWTELYNILENARISGKLGYLKKIFQGTRDDIANFPVIILEPDSEREEQHTVPYHKKIVFTILLTCWLEVINKDIQITGSNVNEKGILDIVSDIKEELFKYPNLNGKCVKFDIASTRYIFETYPYRGAELTINIEYITEATQR